MIRSAIKSIITQCTRWPWTVLLLSIAAAVLAGYYCSSHFAINTDISGLISRDLPWRQREIAFNKAFPQNAQSILVVIDAPTSEAASEAARSLSAALSGRKQLFRSVEPVAETPFFARSAFLFPSTAQVAALTNNLSQAAPLVRVLVADPSLRGLTRVLTYGVMGTKAKTHSLDPVAGALDKASATVEDALANKPATFSWRAMLAGRAPTTNDLRRFIIVHPVLDFAALEPGKAATDAIRAAAARLNLHDKLGATVRLTGSVPISDEEFRTVQDGAAVNGLITVAVVLFILWLALRSPKIIFAVFVTVVVGLAVTAAAGLMMVGALNLISVAFAVLFVGIGVDFGIQYSVRYRAERYAHDDLRKALINAGAHISTPLALAAAATAAGFLAFVPTAYLGVSELGQIAGLGMIIAFFGSITVLPALLTLLNPPGEPEPLGYAALAPVDNFMMRHRMPILYGTAALVVAALPLLYFLSFDFNPIHLRNPNAESIATYIDVQKDPTAGANAVDILAPSQQAARAMAAKLRNVPEISEAVTLANYVPEDQDQKLFMIRAAGESLGPALNAEKQSPPTDAENIAALTRARQMLEGAAEGLSDQGAAAATRLAGDLGRLAAAAPSVRERAQAVFVQPLETALGGLRAALQAQRVTEQNLPQSIRNQWLTADGRARVQVLPKGELKTNEAIRNFARAVLKVEPQATGGPISILESGRTIIRSFIEAGLWALISIFILLWLVLRRIGDVLLTIIPLLVAAVVTLELTVAFGMSLNFANIIALPLLLGIGVAFKIYYMMAWRSGQAGVLQSPLTRAVFFSALTTATAFGSLWFSNHPGTSSMGKLLALSLVCTLAAAVLFQPVLMGPPRGSGDA
ncbi:MAG TPA: MMPL family transporter [Pseudolabrys sp.]|nr:MMPL family transporter [Pseudolabrys sp.]